LGRRSATK